MHLRRWPPRSRRENLFNRNRPRAQAKPKAPSTTNPSFATRNREIGIYVQSTAFRICAIAASIRAIRIHIQATAIDSREIGIYLQEIATYIREIAADMRERVADIEEIGLYRRRPATRRRAMTASSRFPTTFA